MIRIAVWSGFVWLVAALPVMGQSATQLFQQNRYSAVISQLEEKEESGSALDVSEQTLLAAALFKRASFLRDLAGLQGLIGRDYYQRRLDGTGYHQSPLTAYFLGRYLFENRDFEGAADLFSQAADNSALDEDYRLRSRAWQAASLAQNGRSADAEREWEVVAGSSIPEVMAELAFTNWWTGVSGSLSVPMGSSESVSLQAKQAWFGSRKGLDIEAQKEHLLSSRRPDAVEEISDTFQVRYYDVATSQLMAFADFTDAAKRFEAIGTSEALYYAGLSQYNIGYNDRAMALLERSDDPRSSLQLGAIAARSGDMSRANELWSRYNDGSGTKAFALAEVKAEFAGTADDIRRTKSRFWVRDKMSTTSALRLGRALLMKGQIKAAYEVLNANYPKHRSNNLRYVSPEYLIAMSYVKSQMGASHKTEALGHISSLLSEFPIAANVLDMAQGALAPERGAGGSKSRTSM